MSKKILMFALLLGCTVFGQTTKLSELSKAKFVDSRIVYEENGEDIYGYFLLYEKDRINKHVYELEYVLLDKNLNKLSADSFFQSRYSSMWGEAKPTLTVVKKKGDLLYLSIGDELKKFGDLGNALGAYNFRTLSLKDYTISEVAFMKDFLPEKQKSDKISMFDAIKFQFVKPTKMGYFLPDNFRYSLNMRRFSSFTELKPAKHLYFYDLDLNKKWSIPVNQDKKAPNYAEYLYVNEYKTDLLFMTIKVKQKTKQIDTSADNNGTFFEILDAETGAKKTSFTIHDSQELLNILTIKNEEEAIVFYASTTNLMNKGEFYDDKITGYVKIEIDRNTGKELRRDYFRWVQLSDKLAINQFGEINGYGYLGIAEIVRTKEGKTIMMAEAFKPDINTKVLDLFVLEFDSAMKLTQFHKVEKPSHETGKRFFWMDKLDEYNLSDYQFSQKITDTDYAFFYTTRVEKDAEGKEDKFGFGVITYVDGQYDFQQIQPTEGSGKIYPIKAKKGYVLLREEKSEEKENELRLEKINY